MKKRIMAVLTALLATLALVGVFIAPADAAYVSTRASERMGWGPALNGDEFSYVGAPDPAKWSVYNGPGHHNKGLRSPAQNKVAGGYLTIKGDSAGTTGGLSAKFNRQVYARWEARMRTSARDPEYHPVLILWPADNAGNNCDEVDYAEGTADTRLMKVYLHYQCDGDPTTRAQTTIDATQWHNYAVDWSPGAVVAYIDGREVFRDTNSYHIPRAAMKQTIQLDWFPDGSKLNASQMQVDWVRVFKAGEGAPVKQ